MLVHLCAIYRTHVSLLRGPMCSLFCLFHSKNIYLKNFFSIICGYITNRWLFQVGNHIDIVTQKWVAQDAGIGAGVDSYFEYLVKGAIMLQDEELLQMFLGSY